MLQYELLYVPISGSGFYQWVWILPVGLDFAFATGSGLPVYLDMKTPWADFLLCHVIYIPPWHNTFSPTRPEGHTFSPPSPKVEILTLPC